MVCPLCGKSLELKQINLDIALLICPDVKCPYPVGSECIQVHRNLEDMNKQRDIVILPEISSFPNSNETNEVDQKEVFAALDNEINKQSQSSQTDYTEEFNVMDIISDFKSEGNVNESNINNNIVKSETEEANFYVEDFLINYFH